MAQGIQQPLLSLIQRMIVGQINRIHTCRFECIQCCGCAFEHKLLISSANPASRNRSFKIYNCQIVLLEHPVQCGVGIIIALFLKQLGNLTRKDDIAGKVHGNGLPRSILRKAGDILSLAAACLCSAFRYSVC